MAIPKIIQFFHSVVLNKKQLPKKIRDAFKLNWKPVFEIMEVRNNIPDDVTECDASQIKHTFDSGTNHFKTRELYIWHKSKGISDNV